MKTVLFLLLTSFIGLSNAHAEGGSEGGGGGDTRCAEYTAMVYGFAQFLDSLPQSYVDTYNPAIKLSQIKQVESASIRCYPIKRLDREARSYPNDIHTDLLVSDWQNMSLVAKNRLAIHELCVLASIEADGEYSRSTKIMDLIFDTQNKSTDGLALDFARARALQGASQSPLQSTEAKADGARTTSSDCDGPSGPVGSIPGNGRIILRPANGYDAALDQTENDAYLSCAKQGFSSQHGVAIENLGLRGSTSSSTGLACEVRYWFRCGS